MDDSQPATWKTLLVDGFPDRRLHFRGLLQSFERFGVEYLIVGGYAIMK